MKREWNKLKTLNEKTQPRSKERKLFHLSPSPSFATTLNILFSEKSFVFVLISLFSIWIVLIMKLKGFVSFLSSKFFKTPWLPPLRCYSCGGRKWTCCTEWYLIFPSFLRSYLKVYVKCYLRKCWDIFYKLFQKGYDVNFQVMKTWFSVRFARSGFDISSC